MSVVLYHAGLGVRGGYVGVDVFFVISGFLITSQLLGAQGRGVRFLPTFYARRIKRLLPASATVVVVTVLAARLWASPLQVRSIATDGIYTTFYGLNYRLAVEGTQYLNQGAAVSPLQHFWSLGVEEQFYLGWPLLILATAVIPRRLRRPVLAVALAVLIGVLLPLVDHHHRPLGPLGLLLAADPRLGTRARRPGRRRRRRAGAAAQAGRRAGRRSPAWSPCSRPAS